MQGNKCLAYLLVAMALVTFGTPAAKADVVFIETFTNPGPIGAPGDEADFIEVHQDLDYDLTFLFKQADNETDGTYGGSFSLSPIGDSATAEISWDLAGTGFGLSYILLKDGDFEGGHLYTLYGVSDDQIFASGSDQLVGFWDGDSYIEKNISHISFFGVEGEGTQLIPEPTTLLLLGTGLFAIGLASRRRVKR